MTKEEFVKSVLDRFWAKSLLHEELTYLLPIDTISPALPDFLLIARRGNYVGVAVFFVDKDDIPAGKAHQTLNLINSHFQIEHVTSSEQAIAVINSYLLEPKHAIDHPSISLAGLLEHCS